jgi:hypothetical protein
MANADVPTASPAVIADDVIVMAPLAVPVPPVCTQSNVTVDALAATGKPAIATKPNDTNRFIDVSVSSCITRIESASPSAARRSWQAVFTTTTTNPHVQCEDQSGWLDAINRCAARAGYPDCRKVCADGTSERL